MELKPKSNIPNRKVKDALIALANVLLKQRRFDEAIPVIKQVLKAFPKDETFYNLLITAYQESGQADEMALAAAELLKINPTNKTAYTLSRMKNGKPAEEEAKPAPNEVVTITNLSGKVFEGIIIVGDVPDGIYFTYTNVNTVGGGKILFQDLPESWREKYNYDPDRARYYQEEQKTIKVQAQASRNSQFQDDMQQPSETISVSLPESWPGKVTVYNFTCSITLTNESYWQFYWQFWGRNTSINAADFQTNVKYLDSNGSVIATGIHNPKMVPRGSQFPYSSFDNMEQVLRWRW